jgi:hypothetical protein
MPVIEFRPACDGGKVAFFESLAVGVGYNATAQPSLFGFALPSPLHIRLVSWTAFAAAGVGHNPDPFSDVRGIDGTSWNNKRLDLVAFIFQVRKHPVEYGSHLTKSKCVNVFSDDPCRLNLSYDSKHFRPEVAVILCAASLPGAGERLAGESSANNVNWCEVVGSCVSDVCMAFSVWEVTCQDAPAPFVDLYLPDYSESGAGKS